MGEVDIPLLSIKGDGSSETKWYPLRRFGKLKDVTGEVSVITSLVFNFFYFLKFFSLLLSFSYYWLIIA